MYPITSNMLVLVSIDEHRTNIFFAPFVFQSIREIIIVLVGSWSELYYFFFT